MEATTAQTAAQTATAREDTVLALFGGLDSGLQFLIYKHMYALERAERRARAYRARRLGFRFAGYVSEALEPVEYDLYEAVESWWINHRARVWPRRGPQSPPAIEQRLNTCLRAIVGDVFRLDAADGLNLGDADWRAVVASLRFAGPILAGTFFSPWLDQLNARTADGLHHWTIRTTSSVALDDEDADRRVLRVIYGGPQRFETTADPEHSASRVDQVLVSV
jgi:hypothetical protein